jgi:hypothetical protein
MKSIVSTALVATTALAIAGCAALLPKKAGQQYEDAYKAKNRGELESECAAYLSSTTKNRKKRPACEHLAQLNQDELDEARAQKNTELLGKICSGEIPRDEKPGDIYFSKTPGGVGIDAYFIRNKSKELFELLHGIGNASYSAKYVACKYNEAFTAEAAGGVLATMLADCSADGDAMIAEFKKLGASGKERTEKLRELAIGMAKCGKWDAVIVKLMHQDKLMAKTLSVAGLPVEKEVSAYIERNGQSPLSFEHATYMIDGYVAWMVANNRFSHCALFEKHYPAMESKIQTALVHYFAKANCTSAAPLIAPNLAHDDPAYRSQACAALAMLGAKSYARQIERLGNTDPTYKVEGLHKNFWVRASCTQAANKLALR